MYSIKVINGDEIGYYCGLFNIDGGKICGYEDDINDPKVKKYVKKVNAEKAVEKLLDIYKDIDIYKFEIIN